MENLDYKKYLKQGILSSINSLEFLAKHIVEGFITGLHKSPFHGFSVEFSQHRPYMQGDSLKHIDWKVFARSDRYYIKQFEEETNLRCSLLLDISSSMNYKSNDISKLEYASVLTASLAYLMLKQRDATGLMLFDESIKKELPVKSVPVYIKDIILALSEVKTGNDTNITHALHSIAERIKRRGLIIIISDLLDDPQKVLSGLKHLRYNKHEIIVFHIVDDQEIDFDFKGEFIFEDLENKSKIKADSRYIQQEYLRQIKKHYSFLKNSFYENHIDYIRIRTSEPIESALSDYLLKRQKML
ncbi:MAG: DUF58 domain-containing protein [Calditrichaeota bacterium]|nr:MAG: DUF58 domain-containing protein [Calditrichota bacterium]MBL1204166.1 DUF58 domain-containing protein [Calditrichota bacterium]NOG43996.1 DUF58 domain-containing protein [Calditrichota bacterium]